MPNCHLSNGELLIIAIRSNKKLRFQQLVLQKAYGPARPPTQQLSAKALRKLHFLALGGEHENARRIDVRPHLRAARPSRALAHANFQRLVEAFDTDLEAGDVAEELDVQDAGGEPVTIGREPDAALADADDGAAAGGEAGRGQHADRRIDAGRRRRGSRSR